MSPPPLPPNAALFLDLDGTLIDIARTPDQVVVPPELPRALAGLRRKLDHAVAIVSGRPIAQIDALLPGAAYAVAGEHGYAIRPSPDAAEEHAMVADVPAPLIAQAQALAHAHPGALFEAKARGFVLHYRLAPQAGPVFEAALRDWLATSETHRVGQAHMAWEVKPIGIDKGRAVRRLMQTPVFAGRTPVFIGDDITDEDGMAEARSHGGLGLRVQDAFGTAAAVRAWLADLAWSG